MKSQIRAIRMRPRARAILLGSALLGSALLAGLLPELHAAPLAPFEQGYVSWTFAAPACAVDEASLGRYLVGTESFTFSGANTGEIQGRCNIEPFEGAPNYLEVSYMDPGGTGGSEDVIVKLVQVHDTGGYSLVGSFGSSQFTDIGIARHAVPINHDFDFNNNTYFAFIQLRRTGTLKNPAIRSISLAYYIP